jgi:hypothetical protein
MPLIQDNPWLINQLLQAALESEGKLSKKGQAAPPPAGPSVEDSLKAMLDNLGSQITPTKESPDEISHSTGGADLSSHNMDSMGDLVQWLSSNGTKIGGSVIVYPGNIERPSEDYGYFKIEPGTEIVVPLARPDRSPASHWINAEALKKYLVSLQSDPKLKNNVMFQVQLLKLIQDANRQLDVDVSEEYSEPEKMDTMVDALPNPIDPKQWGQAGDPKNKLTVGDLQSPETLNAWLGKTGIGIKGADGKTTTIRDQDFDLCAIINVLNTRAKSLLQRATPESKASATAYVRHVTDIAAKTPNCQLGQSGQKQQPGQGGGSGSGLTPATLSELASIQPFNSRYIDTRLIQSFADKFAGLANDAAVTMLAQQLGTSIQTADNLQAQPGAPVQMGNLTPMQFKNSTGSQQPQQLARILYTIISTAGRLYQLFINQYKEKLGAQARPVEQQMDPQETNLSDLLGLITALDREWQQGYRGTQFRDRGRQ